MEIGDTGGGAACLGNVIGGFEAGRPARHDTSTHWTTESRMGAVRLQVSARTEVAKPQDWDIQLL